MAVYLYGCKYMQVFLKGAALITKPRFGEKVNSQQRKPGIGDATYELRKLPVIVDSC